MTQSDDKIEELTESEIEISNETDFNSKYNSMMNILFVIDSYLEMHPDKATFSDKLNVNLLKVSELVTDEITNSEMEYFCEILIVLCTLCPKKDYYLEKLEDMSDEIINFFLNIIDKYIVVEEVEKTTSEVTKKLSVMKISSSERASRNSLDIQKIIEAEMTNLKNEIKDLTTKNQELVARMDAVKQKEELIIKHEEELNQYTLDFNKMKETLVNKESEIEELKQIININSKKYLEELNTYREKLELATSIENELKNTAKENEKYKVKIKELVVYKTKAEEQENLKQVIDAVMTENEILKKEKHVNTHKLEILTNNNNIQIEKLKTIENEKNRILLELDDANRELYKIERANKKKTNRNYGRSSTYLDKHFISQQTMLQNKDDEEDDNHVILEDIEYPKTTKNVIVDVRSDEEDDNDGVENDWEKERERIKREREKDEEIEGLKKQNTDLESKMFNLKSEVFELKSDITALKKSLKEKTDEVDRYRVLQFDMSTNKDKKDLSNDENKNLLSANLQQIIVLEENLKVVNEERRTLFHEKSKADIEINQLKIDLDKIKISSETDKERLETELKDVKTKLEGIQKEKSSLNKELEEARNLITNNNNLMNKMLDEKISLSNNENKNKDQLLQEKSAMENIYKEKVDKLEKEVATNSGIMKRSVELEYKLEQSIKDIKSFDEKLRIKDNKIKGLEDQINKKEERIKSLVLQIKENNEVYYQTLERKQRDISYYKKLVEEQQVQFTKENDLILNKLFELSLQFNALKCDWDKKIEQEENQCI